MFFYIIKVICVSNTVAKVSEYDSEEKFYKKTKKSGSVII